MRRIPHWRKRQQSGSEIVEFALIASLLCPTFIWMFANSMNLIRMIIASEVTGDIGNQYIHGVDYTTYEAQTVAQKLATGFGLNIGSSYTGNNPFNDTNTTSPSNAWIITTEIVYVGTNSCASLPSGVTCNNLDKYVYVQWSDFGNKTLTINGTQVVSGLGSNSMTLCTGTESPGTVASPTCDLNSNGIVLEYLTDTNAQCANCASYFTTQLSDGQVAYVAETFFASPDLDIAAFPGGGIHSIDFY